MSSLGRENEYVCMCTCWSLVSGSSGASGWGLTCVVESSLSLSLDSMIRVATRADWYFAISSGSVSHFLAPSLLFLVDTLSSWYKVLWLQCPSHWSHCSKRTPNFSLPRATDQCQPNLVCKKIRRFWFLQDIHPHTHTHTHRTHYCTSTSPNLMPQLQHGICNIC